MKIIIDGKEVANVSYLKVVALEYDLATFPGKNITVEYQNLDNHARERSRCSSLEVYEDMDDGK